MAGWPGLPDSSVPGFQEDKPEWPSACPATALSPQLRPAWLRPKPGVGPRKAVWGTKVQLTGPRWRPQSALWPLRSHSPHPHPKAAHLFPSSLPQAPGSHPGCGPRSDSRSRGTGRSRSPGAELCGLKGRLSPATPPALNGEQGRDLPVGWGRCGVLQRAESRTRGPEQRRFTSSQFQRPDVQTQGCCF